MKKDQHKYDYTVSLYVRKPMVFDISNKIVTADTPESAIRRLIFENKNLFDRGMVYTAEVVHPDGTTCLRVRQTF